MDAALRNVPNCEQKAWETSKNSREKASIGAVADRTQFRRILPDYTTTDEPILQYRFLTDGGIWSDWINVPLHIVLDREWQRACNATCMAVPPL